MMQSIRLQSQLIPTAVCHCRHFASTSSDFGSVNANYTVSPVYHNRNPRNLEKLALARKRLGWKLQAPRKDYYHKLIFDPSNRNTSAQLEHWTGTVVLTASTREWAIRDQLYSCTDVAACANIGRVLAQRCVESGITEVFFDDGGRDTSSMKMKAFLKAFEEMNIALKEQAMIEPRHTPGINYDGYNRYAEPKLWQDDYQKL